MPTLLAKCTAKDGMAAKFEEVARKMVAAVNDDEPGALLYMLTRSEENPNEYVFIERYRDDDAVAAHMKTPHMKTIGRELFQCMHGPPEVTRLTDV